MVTLMYQHFYQLILLFWTVVFGQLQNNVQGISVKLMSERTVETTPLHYRGKNHVRTGVTILSRTNQKAETFRFQNKNKAKTRKI